MEKLIEGAIRKNGFSLVDAISNCHTYYGRFNREGDAVAMLQWMKKHAMPIKAAKALSPEKLEGKFLTGVLHETDTPEFTDQYQKLIDRLTAKGDKK